MIIVGDCIEVLKTLEPNSFDLIFADPPYNLGIDYGEGANADRLKHAAYVEWTNKWIREACDLLSSMGSLWILINEDNVQVVEFAMDSLLFLRNRIIWHETFSQYQECNFTNEYRQLLYYVSDDDIYPHWYPNAIRIESQRQIDGDKRANPEGRVPGNVWEIPRLCGNHPGRVDWHPCQLPQAPLTRILRACLPPASEQVCEVLEIFSGSGIFGLATKQEGHNYTGIEKNPEYAAKANERIEAYTRQLELGI